MDYISRFESLYHKSPDGTVFCPYRVCPIGAHIDHQLGKVTGFAIDKGIHIAFSTKLNGVVELASMQFPKRAQWHVRDVPQNRRGDWADYLRGATRELSVLYPLHYGVSAVIEGDLRFLSQSSPNVLLWLRRCEAETMLVIANYSGETVPAVFPQEVSGKKWTRVLTNRPGTEPSVSAVRPWLPWEAEVYVLA